VKVSAHIDRPSPKIDPETLNDAELVRELLGSDERGLAALALHLLVLQPSPEGLNLLLELLGGTDDFLRKEAAEFLGRLRARVAIPLLVQMAHSTDDKERDVALEALWSIASSD
jgi:HEAT repeat protein